MTTNLKILLVDDEILVRDELGGLLQDEGYEVITGADGEEGLALFRGEKPDMVISDVRMPRRDGLSLAVAIRKEDPMVPITVITGHGTESMAIEALRAGVTDFIKKPVRLEGLMAALSRMEAARRTAVHGGAVLPPTVELKECTWTYKLQTDFSAISPFVDALLRRCGTMDQGSLMELGLALRELILNAMEHGNLGLTYRDKTEALEAGTFETLLRERLQLPEHKNRQITVLAHRQGRRIAIQITDQGVGFDWRSLPDPTAQPHVLSSHGRGILLARLSVDRLDYNDQGNQVTLVKMY